MSTQMSDARHRRASAALAALGAALGDHQVLSVQCAHSHHVAAVYDTAEGLVYRTVTGPHGHGRKDRTDEPHHDADHGTVFTEILEDPQAGEMLPGWCDCGPWSLARADLVADVRSGARTTHVG